MTQPPPTAPLGVCVWDAPRYTHYLVATGHYVHEILGHAGLCYEQIAPEALAERLPGLRILLTVGETEPPPALKEQLAAWVEAGGAWISVGGACGLAQLLGVEVEPPAYRLYGFASNLGEGYLDTGGPPTRCSIISPSRCTSSTASPCSPQEGRFLPACSMRISGPPNARQWSNTPLAAGAAC